MESRTTVWLVRHGETLWNRDGRMQGHIDVELSPEGERQAQLVAERLRSKHFAAIYSSDLKRAWDTAQTIGRALGVEPQPVQGLREFDIGELGGLSFDEEQEKFPEFFEEFNRNPATARRPGGESNREHSERSWGTFEDLVSRHQGERLLVVSHGGTIRALLKRALGIPEDRHIHMVLGNTAITVLRKMDGHWYLCVFNDTTHLEELPY